jgi:hypothetical protein
MSEVIYTETGGIRYGHTYWFAKNFTWPFAEITIESGQILIRVSLGKVWSRSFVFPRSSISSIRKRRGFFGVGIEIEHLETDYPPFVLFWTFRYASLKGNLETAGYQVTE